MKGIFVNENGCIPYAEAIVNGYKTIETRSRNMLSACVGENVAVIRTRRGRKPEIVGFVDIVSSEFCHADEFDKYFNQHCVPPQSKYACHGKGKWFYHLENAEAFFPQPLPSSAVRHGRSWCEF